MRLPWPRGYPSAPTAATPAGARQAAIDHPPRRSSDSAPDHRFGQCGGTRTEQRSRRPEQVMGQGASDQRRRAPASVRAHPPQIRAHLAPDDERIPPDVRRLDVAVDVTHRPRLVEASPQPVDHRVVVRMDHGRLAARRPLRSRLAACPSRALGPRRTESARNGTASHAARARQPLASVKKPRMPSSTVAGPVRSEGARRSIRGAPSGANERNHSVSSRATIGDASSRGRYGPYTSPTSGASVKPSSSRASQP